jgi:hypothetical protein
MSSDSPKNQLLAGVKILDSILTPHGFCFQLQSHEKGSGGWFASGSYLKDSRRLELHFRHSLGQVTYHIGEDSLDHETYMRLLGIKGRSQYPDFPGMPLQSFEHLAADIQNYCSDFVCGDGSEFHSLVTRYKLNPSMFRGIP